MEHGPTLHAQPPIELEYNNQETVHIEYVLVYYADQPRLHLKLKESGIIIRNAERHSNEFSSDEHHTRRTGI